MKDKIKELEKKIKILHLEDSLKDSELIHSLIESGGIEHDYYFADNEKDYLRILEKEKINLILSDYSMPEYSGDDALKIAREKYFHIPFIFVSGKIEENTAIDAMLNGATDYVLKNKLERLVPAIKRAMHEYELEHDRKHANEEKEKRAAELIIAKEQIIKKEKEENEEREEKEKLVIANEELNKLIIERKKAEKALQDSEEKFSKSFMTSPYAITITRAKDGSFIDVNDAFQQITGYTREEGLANSSIGLKVWENISDRNNVVDDLSKGKEVISREFNFRKKNGEIITCLFSACIITLNNEALILSSIDNINERKKAEEQLKVISENLERSNKELEQFAYVASHDLQEPLRMVSSYTQLLERRYKDKLDADANDFIQYAVDGANRMQKLINDLLDYSRVSSKGKEFIKVDISLILGEAVSNLQQMITDNTAIVTNDELPCLFVDESQIVRVFQNLIENAIKYKKKTELPKIHISCKERNDFYEFSVTDNGIGIDMQFHDRIFVIFQRLHSKEEYPGTGIGLSICKRIVVRHGGKI